MSDLLGSIVEGAVKGTIEGAIIGSIPGYSEEAQVIDGKNAVVMNFSAYKIGLRPCIQYKTKVTVFEDGTVNVTSYNDKTVSFRKEDVLSTEYKLTAINTGMEWFRYILSVALTFIPPFIIGLILAGFNFYSSLIHTLKIKTKSGALIKVYCKNKESASRLEGYLK